MPPGKREEEKEVGRGVLGQHEESKGLDGVWFYFLFFKPFLKTFSNFKFFSNTFQTLFKIFKSF
jgi:hypothetical protein